MGIESEPQAQRVTRPYRETEHRYGLITETSEAGGRSSEETIPGKTFPPTLLLLLWTDSLGKFHPSIPSGRSTPYVHGLPGRGHSGGEWSILAINLPPVERDSLDQSR